MTTNTKKKTYYNHKILLGDGSIFLDARDDDRTPEYLNNRAKNGKTTFEVYSLIRKYGVLSVTRVGEAHDKWTSIARKRALKDAYESMGIKVRNNPRTEGMTEEELEVADAENLLKVI